eukprot:scaffold67137_cov17-Tisochrysis_lutea.AAC.1
MSLKATRACVISRVVMQQLYSNLHFAGRGASIHQLSYPCRQVPIMLAPFFEIVVPNPILNLLALAEGIRLQGMGSASNP